MVFWKIWENFQENIRRSIFFFILLTKTLHQSVFFGMFSNILEYLGMAASKIIHESGLNSFLYYRSGHSQEL